MGQDETTYYLVNRLKDLIGEHAPELLVDGFSTSLGKLTIFSVICTEKGKESELFVSIHTAREIDEDDARLLRRRQQ